ncbi:MAG: glycosyltransferase family 39 protein [Candidatus Shapirobacteria bacterium]
MKDSLKRPIVALIFIILLGIFFRIYNFERGFSFAHDQDLYSWIAKDIIVNKHLRLSGQVTSVDGVFIGPAYYYLMAITYAIFNMNPIGAIVPLTIIGILNILSFYWILKRFYGEKTALIAAFIESISFGMAAFDRWSVPTQPTILWCIWFLFIILEFSRGKLKYMWLYAVLVGLLWNVHIALLPILPIPILVYFLSKGKFKEKISRIKIKQILVSLLIFVVVNSPFFVFEFKHNFSQVKSTIAAIKMKTEGPTGMQKIEKVLDASGREFQQRLFVGWEIEQVGWLWLVIIFMLILLKTKKILGNAEFIGIIFWIFLIVLAQFTSKRPVSEYYFSNVLPILILLVSLCLNIIDIKILSILGIIYLGLNANWLFKKSEMDSSYFFRKQVVEYIKSEVKKNNYPCIAINYIADPGFGVGFRYLFWYEGIPLVKASDKVPIFNIVIPWQISGNEINSHNGRFGVINPKKIITVDPTVCQDTKYYLDPLLGYTE